jgi:hypothetical protein
LKRFFHLEFLCNDFNFDDYDIFVNGDPNQSSHGIKRNQGSLSSLAGNLFSHSGGLYSDYYNLVDYVNYHHHDPNYGGNPINVEPKDNLNVNLFSYFELYAPCDIKINSGKSSGDWQNDLANAEQSMHTDEALLIQLLNEAGNWQLEAEILFASQFGDWYNVYIDLINQSPFLDHGIIESLINNSDFPDLMLRNVLLANPDAAKAQHLLQLIYLRNMPSWMVEDIEAGKSSYGAREVLEGRIGLNKGIQQNAIAQLLAIYGGSISYNGLDSAISLLSRREEVPYSYLLADAYLTKGQYTEALTLVNNLPQTHTLSENEVLNYPSYQSWYSLCAQLAERNQTWLDADSTQIATLHFLADSTNHNAPMLWANHALSLIGEETTYREPVYLPNPIGQKTEAPIALADDENNELVKVYPNPASDVINIISPMVVAGQVVLFDLTGKLVLQTEVLYGTALLNVQDLTPGVYFAKIYMDNEELETKKVVVLGN